jgi:hypothetical protein
MCGLCQLQPHELSHVGLIRTTSRRDQSPAVHCGILMVHAGRHREGQGYGMIFDWQWRLGGCRHAGVQGRSRGAPAYCGFLVRTPVGDDANYPG